VTIWIDDLEGSDTVIAGFTITGGYQHGMLISNSSPTVIDCVFLRNGFDYISHPNAIKIEHNSHPNILNCVFAGNGFTDGYAASGGAIYSGSGCNPSITNCLFVGNKANYGGAISLANSSPIITNCVMIANSATLEGGAIYTHNNCEPIISNTILWTNTAPTGEQIFNYNSTPIISYSDIQGCGGSGPLWDVMMGQDGGGNIDIDPLITSYPDPGPDSVWGTEDDDYGDLHLLDGSPCVNMGDSDAVPVGVVTDFEGDDRIRQCRVDIGADESPYFIDCNENGEADACDILNGISFDINGNLIPDECEDCNENGLPDDYDILHGFSEDCNENDVPDECDIDQGTSEDCNENDIPDECDIATGYSHDYNSNGIPDECECQADLNGDDVVNINDIFMVLGLWGDCDDPCPPYCPGDLTEDCTVNIDDIFSILGQWGECE